MRLSGPGVLVFDGITEWAGNDGVPDEGTVEFASRTVNLGKERHWFPVYVCGGEGGGAGCAEGVGKAG
jgi:hypothetical protein